MAFYTIEPFGTGVPYLGEAIIAKTMADIHARKKGQRAYKTEDFMPKFKKEKPQTTDAMIGLAQRMADSGFGKITTKEDRE